MPFKLKLKKSRQYSVASKSLFVISVEMLDGTNIECTLSSESTGQDCLDVVCQKLGLTQPKFFGLQYMSRNTENSLYWLELDRPIKRQLDKYARGLCVYLRVMYYVISGVRLLNDEVTRYHYFLQLKMDVIEGRISCTPQQAVDLASYSMQAEFGNFDSERHTAHYLKDFQLFPKSFTDPVILESLTDAASRQHAALHNLPQGTAEEYYICACQQLEGYGQEIYAVKDRLGDDAIISVSLTEVSVGYGGGREGRHYAWSDIKNVINHKRDFIIETVDSEKVEFQFSDVESAKNAWRFCVLQHTFYRQYEMNNDQTDKGPPPPPVFHQALSEDKLRQVDSYEDITNTSQQWNHSNQSLNQRTQSTSCLDLNKPTNIDQLRSLLPSYRPAPDYETAIQNKYRNSSGAITTTTTTTINRGEIRNNHAILYSSQPEIHQVDTLFSTHLRYPDVTHNNIEQKYQYHQNNNNLGMFLYKPPPPYPTNRINSNSTPDLAGISQQTKPNNHFVNLVSGSSPDLVSNNNNFYLKQHFPTTLYQQQQQQQQSNPPLHPVHRSHSYLPPQHGTYENLASIFTTTTNNNNLLGRPQQGVIVENPNITKHIKKVYDEHGNIIYCMPANMKQILQENLNSSGFVVTRQLNNRDLNNSNEPIYENIPLPWQNENSEDRSRTQSIHSAPEVINHKVVNAIQNQLQQIKFDENNKTNNNNNNNNNRSSSRENLYANIVKETTDPTLNISRTNTFIVNKNMELDTTTTTITSATTTTSINLSNIEVNTTTGESSITTPFTDTSTSSSTASNKSKKKRWGLLIGRSKSSEKVKSATLGREKDKNKDKHNMGNNKQHRWSTGLPRFNPLPPSISKETMCQLLENKLTDGQLFTEHKKIPEKKQNADFTTALHPDNAHFNRYMDVLPYEDNRLRLTPTKNNKYGYINASHITATVGSKQRFYIAAQGPTKRTLSSFWQCVWEAEVYLIVQLTNASEEYDYMPDANERCLDIDNDYQVWWEFSQNSGNCLTSKIRLCHVQSRRYRTLWHLRYIDWDQQNGLCPKSEAHFLGFLEEMQSVHQHSMSDIPPGHNKNPPIFVHCTTGVDRSGLTILSDLLLYTVDHNQEVCIPRVVELLRHQRPYMVKSPVQYRFVYQLLIHYLKQTRLI